MKSQKKKFGSFFAKNAYRCNFYYKRAFLKCQEKRSCIPKRKTVNQSIQKSPENIGGSMNYFIPS